ncbi:calcium/sodium antiporter [Rhizobiaceae bacterium BDR2-2]|uniref:Calcium/sodium antiporter n=1 Tax=Ectorhizobium quercum TaxID=2965071 RepID=A0AAE3N175_9HYPH|nr:calcium/sodium antiporter [Ectorhizobium quercum]MCX8997425.1 calcium/sodium antiporter [Ectorhizobium quercum]
MTAAVIWCALGLAALVAGAEMLVRGGSTLARQLGISPLTIGLTVVAIGTSTPELAVGIEAAFDGEGGLVVGNIAGTNTFNLLFILGLTALFRPLTLEPASLRLDLPAMVLAALAFWISAADGFLSRVEGALLLTCGLAYTVLVVRGARTRTVAVETALPVLPRRVQTIRRAGLVNVIAMIAGIAIIIAGADWLVDGATDLARRLNVSEALIGLTIVAIGTSSPELVTTIVSTLRNERDIAVGNLLGSGVYNILIILGLTMLVPGSPIPVEETLIRVDIPVMAVATLLCVPVFLSGRRISRIEGGAFLTCYAAYFAYLLLVRNGAPFVQ